MANTCNAQPGSLAANPAETAPAVPRIQDLSFVCTVMKGRRPEVRYFHVEPTGDAGSDYELGIRKAVEYLDFLKAGGHFPLQYLISGLQEAMTAKPWNGAAYGFLYILNGCLAGGANALQYREWSEQVIQRDREGRARLDALDAERKRVASKKAWATRKANLARKRDATASGSAVAGVRHV